MFSKFALSTIGPEAGKSALSYLAILDRFDNTNMDEIGKQAIEIPKDSRLPRSVIDFIQMEEK